MREATTYTDATKLGKYMLPGGRINPGENHIDGLKREIKEEVGLEVEPLRPVFTKEWSPTINGVKSQIIAIFYLCKPTSLEVRLGDEHDDYAWVSEREAQSLEGEFIDSDVLESYFAEVKR